MFKRSEYREKERLRDSCGLGLSSKVNAAFILYASVHIEGTYQEKIVDDLVEEAGEENLILH